MGWFTKLFKPKQIVICQFRELTNDYPTDASHGYTYTWDFPRPPEVGMRVWLDGGDRRLEPGIIAAINATAPKGIELKGVLSPVAENEVLDAHDKLEKVKHAWLNMARREAGLPTPGRKRTRVPEGFPDIEPVEGDATATQAGRHARMWWRAYKLAEELGRDADEVKRFRSIAHRWYAIRDRR